VYEVVPHVEASLPARDRLRGLVLAVTDVLAPVVDRTLQGIVARLRRSISGAPDHRAVIRELQGSGELETRSVDGVLYTWPAASAAADEAPRCVRFLAPFDPLVWDRGRFEHLFGWSYRLCPSGKDA
jgi:hypothetical protein